MTKPLDPSEAQRLARSILRPTIDEVAQEVMQRLQTESFSTRQHVGYAADDLLVEQIVRSTLDGPDYWESLAREQGRSEDDAVAVVGKGYAEVARRRKKQA